MLRRIRALCPRFDQCLSNTFLTGSTVSTISTYVYANDALGRRTRRIDKHLFAEIDSGTGSDVE
jgi:hypothetical protein